MFDIITSDYIPKEQYKNNIYPVHPFIQLCIKLIRKYTLFKPSCWLAYPIYKHTAYRVGNQMIMSSLMFNELRKHTGIGIYEGS